MPPNGDLTQNIHRSEIKYRFLIGSDFSYGKAENSEQEMKPGEHTMHSADVP